MRRTARLLALLPLAVSPVFAPPAAAQTGDRAGAPATGATAPSGNAAPTSATSAPAAGATGSATAPTPTPSGGASAPAGPTSTAAAPAPSGNTGTGAATRPAASTTGAAGNGTAAAALAPAALAVRAGSYKLDPEHGKITWSVNHLGFSTYAGQFAGVTADLTLDPRALGKTSLTATVDLGTVDTLNPKLNEQLKGDGFFDTAKLPDATFKSTSVTPTGPRSARIDGTLTLHGHTAPVVLSATFNNAGVDPVDKRYTIGFDAASIIRRSSFGVSEYVPLIGDDVLLTIEGEFKPAS